MPRDTPLKKIALRLRRARAASCTRAGSSGRRASTALEPKSVKKKLKQPSFAAGVHRDEVYAGAELLGLDLDEHIANVVAALQPIAPELGLRTAATTAPPRGLRPSEHEREVIRRPRARQSSSTKASGGVPCGQRPRGRR